MTAPCPECGLRAPSPRRVAEAELPSASGGFRVIAFASEMEAAVHVALVKGEIHSERPTLVRIHSECLTGDAFGSLRCDCGPQLRRALELAEAEGAGVVLYLRQEGRGIGLANKIRAYALQDRERLDTVEANERLGFPADARDFTAGAQILWALGVRKLRLLTNNPAKRTGLEAHGLEVVERIPIEIPPNERNRDYLRIKREKLGHLLQPEE